MRSCGSRVAKRLICAVAAGSVCLLGLGRWPSVAKTAGIACQQETILLSNNLTDIHKQWKVKKNEVCVGQIDVPLSRSNSMWLPVGFINNFVIVKRAAHGIVGVTNSNVYGGFAYQPNDDFTGADAFEISVDHHLDSGNDSDESQKVRIRIDVEVMN